MAKRAFPDILRNHITSCPIRPVNPQDVLQSQSGRAVQVVRRGTGRWTGVLEIGTMGRNSDELKREVEAFADSLEGQFNTFDLPVLGRSASLASGTSLALAGAPQIVGGFARATLSDSSVTGLERGNCVSIGSRLYRLQSDIANGVFTALPAVAYGTTGNAVEWESPVVEVRLTERGVQVSRETPSVLGPWSLEWISVV